MVSSESSSLHALREGRLANQEEYAYNGTNCLSVGMRKLFDLACFPGYGTHIRILKEAVIPRKLDHRITI